MFVVPAFSYDVTVNYVLPTDGSISDLVKYFKSIMVRVTHPTLSPITDTMIIGSGL